MVIVHEEQQQPCPHFGAVSQEYHPVVSRAHTVCQQRRTDSVHTQSLEQQQHHGQQHGGRISAAGREEEIHGIRAGNENAHTKKQQRQGTVEVILS